MLERYNLRNLKRTIRNPRNIWLELLLINGWFYRRFSEHQGVDVIEEDWDNLILIDACRFDLFEEHSNLPGELKSVYSKATESWGFMKENFVGRDLHDTIYITSNPHAYKIPDGTFFDLCNLLDNDWDETLRTVPPESVVEAALEVHSKHPNKRLIVHFMQPHYPFLNESNPEVDYSGLEIHLDKEDQSGQTSPWHLLLGPSPEYEDEIIQAYTENYKVVFPHVKELLDELDGRSVVSSDHGNLIGERTYPIPIRGYGHPEGVPHKNLITVPWLVLNGDSRREIIKEPPQSVEGAEEDVINNRLQALGYQTQ